MAQNPSQKQSNNQSNQSKKSSAPNGDIDGASSPSPPKTNNQLKSIVDRIERLEDEKAILTAQITDIYHEAKGNGFDVKALHTIIRMRKQSAAERAEQEALVETYKSSLGMLIGTPLGDFVFESIPR